MHKQKVLCLFFDEMFMFCFPRCCSANIRPSSNRMSRRVHNVQCTSQKYSWHWQLGNGKKCVCPKKNRNTQIKVLMSRENMYKAIIITVVVAHRMRCRLRVGVFFLSCWDSSEPCRRDERTLFMVLFDCTHTKNWVILRGFRRSISFYLVT